MNRKDLREGLLEAERRDSDLERRYRERLRGLTERRLSTAARVGHALGLVIALVLVARFIQLFVRGEASGRPEGLMGLGLGLAFSAAWLIAEAAVLRAGVERFFSHGAARTLLITVFAFLLAGLMVWAGLVSSDAARGMRLILFGLVFWCALGLPFLTAYLIQGAELRVRASLLRLELDLIEHADSVKEGS